MKNGKPASNTFTKYSEPPLKKYNKQRLNSNYCTARRNSRSEHRNHDRIEFRDNYTIITSSSTKLGENPQTNRTSLLKWFTGKIGKHQSYSTTAKESEKRLLQINYISILSRDFEESSFVVAVAAAAGELHPAVHRHLPTRLHLGAPSDSWAPKKHPLCHHRDRRCLQNNTYRHNQQILLLTRSQKTHTQKSRLPN